MNSPIYLDYAAATPVDSQVLAAMEPYFTGQFYNPSANYMPAQVVAEDIQTARRAVAHVLGSRSDEIIFTAGATEANNLAIQGVMQQYPTGNVVVSGIEHESVLEPAKSYAVRYAPVSPDGLVDVPALEKLIDDNTVLVSIMYANNEVGTIQSIRTIAATLEQKRHIRLTNLPLLLHTDAAQAANYLDLHVARLGVDMLSLNGGKIYGPKQSGALYVSRRIGLKPIIVGGGQERNLRAGTENVPSLIGLAAALEQAQSLRAGEVKRLAGLQKKFIGLLKKEIPRVVINGSLTKRLPNNVHITILGTDNERILIGLDEAGILAAAGSACSAARTEPSHVLKAMGLSDGAARASLRFTFGRATTQADILQTVQTLARLIAI